MRVISAYLLAVLGGKANPTADDINKILGSVGVEAPAANVEQLLKELAGKDVMEVVAAGREKLQSVAAVAVPAGGAPAGGDAGGAAPAAKEPEPESEEEEMGLDLFG